MQPFKENKGLYIILFVCLFVSIFGIGMSIFNDGEEYIDLCRTESGAKIIGTECIYEDNQFIGMAAICIVPLGLIFITLA